MSTRRQFGLILALFIATRALLVIAGVLALAYRPSVEGDEYKHLLDGGPALDMWYRWDAGFYATIATGGYDWFNERRPSDDMAFLPVYPLATHGVMAFSACVMSPYDSTCATVAGLVVSNAALVAAAFLLFDLVRRRWDEKTAWRAVILLLISPISIFLSGIYTESLFLLLTILVFWLLEQERFLPAVLVAALAALTRNVGVALVSTLLWVAWQSSPPVRSRHLLLALLPGVVFGLYILGMGLYVGQPLAYFQTNSVTWGRLSRSPIEAFTVYFSGEAVSLFGWSLSWIDLGAALVYLVAALVLLRVRVTLGLFALGAVLLPVLSGSLISMPRYGLAVFAFYVLIALWARRGWQQALIYAVFALLLLFFLERVVTYHWIA